jgi:hypothetical protein
MRSLILLAIVFIMPQFACGQEWSAKLTNVYEPVPEVVTPGNGTAPPSDAIVLFDGTNFDSWESTKGVPIGWTLENGAMTVVKGTGFIRTKQKFRDVQLHIEWRTPTVIAGDGQKRGNSGVYLQEKYEIQVLDSYENSTYVNGQAGAVYKQHIPLVNACRPPGKWQTSDIIFTAPRFNEDGSLFSPARVTVIHNGVLIQNNVTILGTTVNVGMPNYKPFDNYQSISLQDHGDPVSYRNIWIREL